MSVYSLSLRLLEGDIPFATSDKVLEHQDAHRCRQDFHLEEYEHGDLDDMASPFEISR
jgi:hypothetical protein